MSFEMTVQPMDGYLHVRVTGINSPSTVRGYLPKVREACLEHQCPFVLIEENLAGPGLSLGNIYQIVSEGSQRSAMYVRRVALVDMNPEHSLANMQFAETVAVNRGLHMRTFADLSAAETWIRAEVAGASGS